MSTHPASIWRGPDYLVLSGNSLPRQDAGILRALSRDQDMRRLFWIGLWAAVRRSSGGPILRNRRAVWSRLTDGWHPGAIGPEFWYPAAAAMGNAQLALALQKAVLTGRADSPGVSFVHSGPPYYYSAFVDHLVLRVDRPNARAIYAQCLQEYALNRLVEEGAGYGIALLSQFLHRLATQQPGVCLLVDYRMQDTSERALAREYLRLATAPERTRFADDPTDFRRLAGRSAETLRVTVERVVQRDRSGRLDGGALPDTADSRLVRIPIKRWVSLPLHVGTGCLSPKPYPLLPGVAVHPAHVFAVGSPEANPAWLHLLNQYRWQAGESRAFGIAENQFDAEQAALGPRMLLLRSEGEGGWVQAGVARPDGQEPEARIIRFHLPGAVSVTAFIGVGDAMTQLAFILYTAGLATGRELFQELKPGRSADREDLALTIRLKRPAGPAGDRLRAQDPDLRYHYERFLREHWNPGDFANWDQPRATEQLKELRRTWLVVE